MIIHQPNRRNFIKTIGTGTIASAAAALCPSNVFAGFCNLSYRLHGDGWNSHGRRRIVAAAMDLVGNMSRRAVLNRSYQLSGNSYHLTNGTWGRTNPNSWYNNYGYKDVLWAQVSNLDGRRTRPVVNIRRYYSRTFDWGKANLDLVSVRIHSNGTTTLSGEFDISLNHRYLGGGGDGSSPAAWAGLIVHEMLHNLGHLHGARDYRNSLQINALQQAVYEAGRGSERIVAARYFRCGGRI